MWRISVQWGRGLEYWVTGLREGEPGMEELKRMAKGLTVGERGALPRLKVYRLEKVVEVDRKREVKE